MVPATMNFLAAAASAGDYPRMRLQVSPNPGSWSPAGGLEYNCTFGVSVTGGVAPFSYEWSTDGGAAIVFGQGTYSVVVQSTSRLAVFVNVVVRDSVGQIASAGSWVAGDL